MLLECREYALESGVKSRARDGDLALKVLFFFQDTDKSVEKQWLFRILNPF